MLIWLDNFLATATGSPYLDNCPLVVAGKAEVRHYRAKYVAGDQEEGNHSDEMVVSCAR